MDKATVNVNKTEFQAALSSFTGTESYHQHILSGGLSLMLTDGCAFVREHAAGGAYWLFDLILSWQLKLRKHRFQVWNLRQLEDSSWYIECSDGNKNFIIGQDIPYSDFPIESIEIWIIDGVALLPNEY